MKLKVFEKKSEEDVVYFKLVEQLKAITLMAVNSKGERLQSGDILYIDGTGIHLYNAVNVGIGLPVTEDGTVIVD